LDQYATTRQQQTELVVVPIGPVDQLRCPGDHVWCGSDLRNVDVLHTARPNTTAEGLGDLAGDLQRYEGCRHGVAEVVEVLGDRSRDAACRVGHMLGAAQAAPPVNLGR